MTLTEWGERSQSGKYLDLHHGQNYVKGLPCSLVEEHLPE